MGQLFNEAVLSLATMWKGNCADTRFHSDRGATSKRSSTGAITRGAGSFPKVMPPKQGFLRDQSRVQPPPHVGDPRGLSPARTCRSGRGRPMRVSRPSSSVPWWVRRLCTHPWHRFTGEESCVCITLRADRPQKKTGRGLPDRCPNSAYSVPLRPGFKAFGELQLGQLGIEPTFGNQLIMGALCHNAAFVHHHNPVGLFHGGPDGAPRSGLCGSWTVHPQRLHRAFAGRHQAQMWPHPAAVPGQSRRMARAMAMRCF